MKAFRDGDQICIAQDDFVNLAESSAVFVALDSKLGRYIDEFSLDGLPEERLRGLRRSLSRGEGYDGFQSGASNPYPPRSEEGVAWGHGRLDAQYQADDDDKTLRIAKSRALAIYNDWVNNTGILPFGTSYYYECQGIVMDGVEIGYRAEEASE